MAKKISKLASNKRTTFLLDKETADYFEFLVAAKTLYEVWECFQGNWEAGDSGRYKFVGISGRTYYLGYAEDTWHIAVDKARNLQRKDGIELSRTVRKGVAIPDVVLKAVNALARKEKISRDLLVVAAIRYVYDRTCKVEEMELRLLKKFLRDFLEPTYERFTKTTDIILEDIHGFFEDNNFYDGGLLYTFDVENGMSFLRSYESMGEDIKTIKDNIAHLEEMLCTKQNMPR